MANFKKISAVALCSAMALSLGACGNNIAGPDTTYAAVIDGYKVPAGVFIAMQMNSYYDAAYYTEPTDESEETTASAEAAETTASETEATTTTAYLEENNKRINYIKMELKDGEGNLLKSEGKDEIKTMAEDYIDRIKGGEDFATVSKEYSDYYDKLVADAQAAESTDDEASDETAETEETASSYTDNETVVTKDGSYPSEAVVTKAFESKVGDVFLVEEDEVYYVVTVLDLYADENYYSDNESTVRHQLKDDEFDQTVGSWTETQNVEINEAAYKRYKIEKFLNN